MSRPYTICHMCTTIDGKILVDRWGKLPGSKSARSLYETTAASYKVDAWMVGTTTMREFSGRDQKLKHARLSVGSKDYVSDRNVRGLAIGLDAKADLRFQSSDIDGDHAVLCITEKAGNDYRAHLQSVGVSYLVCGRTEINLAVALKKLHDLFGLRKLMIEGGGKFNGSMLRSGLIDEISHVVVPIVDGGTGVSGIFEIGESTKRAAAVLRVKSHQRLAGGAHWFRYRVVKNRA